MSIKTRYIFGCSHENRNILSATIFERGLEIPAIFCDDCITICDICLMKKETKTYEELKLCEKCYTTVKKISNN